MYKLHRSLKTKSPNQHEDALGIDSDRYNVLSQFAQFEGLDDFQHAWKLFGSYISLDRAKPTYISLLVDKRDSSHYREKLHQAFHADQSHKIRLQTYSSTDDLHQRPESTESQAELILFVPPSDKPRVSELDQINLFLEKKTATSSNLVPIYPERDDPDKPDWFGDDGHVFYEHRHFDFVCQAVQAHLDHWPAQNPGDDPPGGQTVIEKVNDTLNWAIDRVPVVWAWSAGLMTLIAVVLFVLFVPCPTTPQLFVLRMVLAVGFAAICSAAVEQAQVNHHRIRGSSTLLALLLLTLLNPLKAISVGNCNISILHGKVMLEGRPLEGARIQLSETATTDLSNGSGQFTMRLPEALPYDSIHLEVSYEGLTQNYVLHVQDLHHTQLVQFDDTITPLTELHIRLLVEELSQAHEQRIAAELRSLKAQADGDLIEMGRLESYYLPFERPNKKRNYYHFESPTQHLTYQTNLLKAGVAQAELLDPYSRHGFEQCEPLLLDHEPPGDQHFKLSYILVNKKALRIRKCPTRKLDIGLYRVDVTYGQYIRMVHVELEWQMIDNELAHVRTMTFYGFLPHEQYYATFKNGHWKLNTKAS